MLDTGNKTLQKKYKNILILKSSAKSISQATGRATE
jgi:hypothetical protein